MATEVSLVEKREDILVFVRETLPDAERIPDAIIYALIERKEPKPIEPNAGLRLGTDWPMIIEAIKTLLAILSTSIGIWNGLKAAVGGQPSKEKVLEAMESDPGLKKMLKRLSRQEIEVLVRYVVKR